MQRCHVQPTEIFVYFLDWCSLTEFTLDSRCLKYDELESLTKHICNDVLAVRIVFINYENKKYID